MVARVPKKRVCDLKKMAIGLLVCVSVHVNKK